MVFLAQSINGQGRHAVNIVYDLLSIGVTQETRSNKSDENVEDRIADEDCDISSSVVETDAKRGVELGKPRYQNGKE